MKISKDVIIIGGGFFGMYIAEYFARQGKEVLLCERESDFMQRASYVNQARVHNGYHYPRSMLTALRSRISFPRFSQEFRPCIDQSFEKYYMIGKLLGNVTAKQFQTFCARIGAPCVPASYKITQLVNPSLIEAVFSTVEYAFDSVKLKEMMKCRLWDVNVKCLLNTTVHSIRQTASGLAVKVYNLHDESEVDIEGKQVFNCTYSMMNYLLTHSGIECLPLKHEMTEMCLVEVPDELKDKAITVMCGPFFSTMPFPSQGLHSFSHVRYTPHYEWYDDPDRPYLNAHDHFSNVEKKSAWVSMKADARRYIPVLNDCKYISSMWEVKTLLPKSEVDDSRPILFKPNYGLKGFHCVMGGKIDNVYDVVEAIEKAGLNQ